MKLESISVAAVATLSLLAATIPAQAQQADPKPDGTQAPAEAKPATIEPVVVTGIRASKQRSIAAKRDADGIVDVISAEDIGKLPDKNIADAVQRLPGVSISK